jgi:putative intracellular protease/amidase
MKVLMVLTSHDQLGNTGRKTGFWLEELAAPYYVFKDAGAQIILASPKGGRPPLDPKSNEPNFQTDITRRFEKDTDAGAQLDRTVRLDSVKQDRDRFHQWRGRRGGIDEGGALPCRRRTGATFSKVKNWGVHTVADGRLITGQNPASSGPAARLLIDTLNKKAK